MAELNNDMINAVRVLSMDQVQAASSGHPGAPMGAAAFVCELWANHMNFNPEDPDYLGRDRFILSAGHASALQYSLLHLFGYDLSIEDLKNFRQWGSKTPGHPEYKATPGIECTTGPLGAGVAMGVGMAIAQAHLASIFNKDDFKIFDNYVYVYAGDGCMMEGITSEASSLAGSIGLDKLIVMYDSNDITIEGSTDLAFSEDVCARYRAYGWQVIEVSDGNDTKAVGKAIEQAKAEKNRPSFIKVKTQIGYGSPERQNTAKAHGEPLGAENCISARKFLGWSQEEPFKVPDKVYADFKTISAEKVKTAKLYEAKLNEYFKKYPEMGELFGDYFGDNDGRTKKYFESIYIKPDKDMATRSASGEIIQELAEFIPNLTGGSADLGPSNKTIMNNVEYFSKKTPFGRNIHYGVRELAMAGIANGILCYGGLKTYIATFFVFSDFAKPMLRLAALMGVPLISIFTHDSIGVGEDGATHQPVEQLAGLRAMPNFNVFRPADYMETVCAWQTAVLSKTVPTALVLSRQNLPQLEGSSKEALKGGYIISDSKKDSPDGIIMASGSEVQLALEAQKLLKETGADVRVVSMPCMEIFENQAETYKSEVLPKSVKKRVAVEAGASESWFRYTGSEGVVLGIDRFGASAPAKKIFEEYGMTAGEVVSAYKNL